MIESMCGACVLVWPDTQTKLSPINTHARYNYWYDLASYTHENDKCPHLLDWTSKNTISDQTNILLYWWFCLRLFHVSFSLRRKTEMFFFCIGCSKFLYQIIALFGWSLFLIWLHLTIVTSWFSSLKFLCLKKTMFLWWICIVRQFSWTFNSIHYTFITCTMHNKKKHTQTDLNCHSKPQIFTKDERKLY